MTWILILCGFIILLVIINILITFLKREGGDESAD